MMSNEEIKRSSSRRSFLKAGAMAACIQPLSALAEEADRNPVPLPEGHVAAVNRRRRIVVQYDAFSQFDADFRQWIDYRFRYADEAGSQIDSLWWDIGGDPGTATYPSKVLPAFNYKALDAWREQGIDWAGELIEQTRQRKLEVFWNHRISEVELAREGGLEMKRMNPIKEANPDWVIKT